MWMQGLAFRAQMQPMLPRFMQFAINDLPTSPFIVTCVYYMSKYIFDEQDEKTYIFIISGEMAA